MIEVSAKITSLQPRGEIRKDRRYRSHFGNRIKFDITKVRVGEGQGGGEGAKDDVAKLDAARRDHIAEAEVILAEELGKVVEKYKKQSQRPAIKVAGRLLQFGRLEEGREELE